MVDTGLMRKNEFKYTFKLFKKKYKLNVRLINASSIFLKKLKNIYDPEKKRKIIGKLFIRIFERKVKQAKKKRFSFVLTGGKSPIYLYKELAKNKNLPWRKIYFFIGDERYVNKNSKHSNIKMCKKYLLSKIKISDNQIYKIYTNK